MTPIPARIVELTWIEQAQLEPSEIQAVVQKFSRQQPVILAYLMAMGDNMLNRDERELLLYLGTAVWQMMERGGKRLKQVDEETIQDFEDKNIKMLQYLEDEPNGEFNTTVEKIIRNYNQKEVLRYVVEALFEEDDEEAAETSEIREEMLGQIFVFLKIVIDCLDQ